MASKTKISRTGATRFLEILEETLLILRCESFKEINNADTISHPKFYFFDPGVLNGLLGGFDLTQDRIGLLFEHAVIAQLKNTASATHRSIDIYYFRTRNGLEVDFIVRIQNHWRLFVSIIQKSMSLWWLLLKALLVSLRAVFMLYRFQSFYH